MSNKNWEKILEQLENGEVRAAEPTANGWEANVEVKEAILASFSAGENTEYSGIYDGFVDKDNLPPRRFT
ncbi:MAG TPA: hypothetical protein VK112_11120, partial [Fodinibius sp.]|nr:hypothetical protein [Fodinibius sp.]